ncbi:MAG: 16S rRNA (guanine(966)-N(2))-methyltransferase RsmD [Candidatus Nanopelagicales bacterium]
MTRIIAGLARGRRIAVPAGPARPTADRVREAMFASLDHALGGFVGTRVLDLFAGSGALGLEAASRGATSVVLVERDRTAAAVARANAATVGVPGVQVLAKSVTAFLAGSAQPVDLVLADPPYAMTASEVEAFLAQLTGGWLAPGAVLMVERATRGGEISWPSGLVALRQSTYGSTCLWYGQGAPEGEDP